MQRQNNGATRPSTTALIATQLAPEPNAFNMLMPILCLLNIRNGDLCALVISYCEMPYQASINANYLGQHSHGLANVASAAQRQQEVFAKFMPLITEARLIKAIPKEEQMTQEMKYAAEDMLQQESSLALVRQPVKLSQGIYRMTAFQKAFYAFDQDLWKMIMRYMTPGEVKHQLEQHVAECKERGLPRHVDLTCLMMAHDALRKMMDEDPEMHDDLKLAENYSCLTGPVAVDAPNILRKCYPDVVDSAQLRELRFYYFRPTQGQHQVYCNFVISGRYPLGQEVAQCVDLLGAIESVRLNVCAANQLLKTFGVEAKPAEFRVPAASLTASQSWIPGCNVM